MASSQPRVTILGAGVAGLAAALALRQRAGLQRVRLLERDPPAHRRAGHGLLLMPNGVRVLQCLGLEEVLAGQRPLTAAILQSESGTVVHREPLDGIHCITRESLVEAMRRRLPADWLRQGSGVRRIDLAPAPVIELEDGTRLTLDGSGFDRTADDAALSSAQERGEELLIGAEGWRSPLGQALNPGLARPRSRVHEVVTSCELPDLASLLGSRFIKTLVPSKGLAFGLLAPSPRCVIGFLQFDTQRHPAPRSTDPQELARFVRELMEGAPEPVASYLQRADWRDAHLWRPLDADLPPRMCQGNAVLIGDAAHPLLPFTSQGVSAALEDALLLADAVAVGLADRRPLAPVLEGLTRERRRDLEPILEGGRAILRAFVDPPVAATLPYVDDRHSPLEEHLRLPLTGLLDLFRLLDADASGDLEPVELRRLLWLLDLPLELQRPLLAAADADHNQRLSYGELLRLLAGEGSNARLQERLRELLTPRGLNQTGHRLRTLELLRQIGGTGDGQLDLEEFCAALPLLGISTEREEAERRFRELDRDGSGRLSPAELAEACELLGSADLDPLFSDAAIDRELLAERAFNHRWATQPAGVIPLTAADSDFPVAAVIREAIHRHTADGYLGYGPPAGLPLLREVAAAHLSARHLLALQADRVLVSDGAASALFLVARAVLEPGDEALIPDPGDFLLERSVLAAGGRVRRYRLEASRGYRLEAEAIEALITPRTRLLILCSPHNPLGRVWSRAELLAVAAIAERHDLAILSDEVWSDIVHPPHRHIATASLDAAISRRTYTVYGLSKGYGLAGLRVGLLIGPDAASVERLLAISHADETAYGASVLSQVAAAAAYREAGPWLERFLAHLGRRRTQALRRLQSMPGVRCHEPEGTFVLFPDTSAISPDQDALAHHLLERHQLAVVPGSRAFFGEGARGHLRLSTATSSAVLEEGLRRLEAGLRSFGAGG